MTFIISCRKDGKKHFVFELLWGFVINGSHGSYAALAKSTQTLYIYCPSSRHHVLLSKNQGQIYPILTTILFHVNVSETCSSAADEYVEVGHTDQTNTLESESSSVDFTQYEEEEVDIDTTISSSTTTLKPTTVKPVNVDEEHDGEGEEEEEDPEYSSYYPDAYGPSQLERELQRELENNLIVETLPNSDGHQNDTSNTPKGPYVHVGRSRKPKSKSTSSSSASVVRTNDNAEEQSSDLESSATTVHTRSSITCAVFSVWVLTHFLLPTR